MTGTHLEQVKRVKVQHLSNWTHCIQQLHVSAAWLQVGVEKKTRALRLVLTAGQPCLLLFQSTVISTLFFSAAS